MEPNYLTCRYPLHYVVAQKTPRGDSGYPRGVRYRLPRRRDRSLATTAIQLDCTFSSQARPADGSE